jgi:hypothetical protein
VTFGLATVTNGYYFTNALNSLFITNGFNTIGMPADVFSVTYFVVTTGPTKNYEICSEGTL